MNEQSAPLLKGIEVSTFYERLSTLDNSFLALETPSIHMHVAGLAVFEAGSLRTPEGGIDVASIGAHIASKLHLIPRYRQRLAYVPFEQHAVWVDDEQFSIDYHVRHTSLPRPGSMSQLRALMGRLVSQPLDHSKPLWEVWVVEGLAGDRFGLISKVHHCMIDGIASVDLMAVLFSLSPVAEVAEPEAFEPRPIPTGTELVVRETARRAGRAVGALRSVRTLVEDAQTLAQHGVRRVRAVGASLSSGWLSQASDTPLNGEPGTNRVFGTLDTDLDTIKSIKNALGGSVNDVVLAAVAGGVRSFLRGSDFDVSGIDFRVMAPVSVRSLSDRGTMGNQVAMWLASLPVGEPDPVARLEAVKRETMKLKTTDQALGAATLVSLSAGAPATLVSLASRLASGARPFNMTVTNVPGPQVPLYFLGAELVAQYPLVPLWHGHGIGVALFSYNGSVAWGFNSAYDVVPDVDGFAAAVEASIRELAAAAAGPPRATRASRPKRRPPLEHAKSP